MRDQCLVLHLFPQRVASIYRTRTTTTDQQTGHLAGSDRHVLGVRYEVSRCHWCRTSHRSAGTFSTSTSCHHAYAIPNTKFFSSGCCTPTLSSHRQLNLYPKFLHISHRENGSFEVLSLHDNWVLGFGFWLDSLVIFSASSEFRIKIERPITFEGFFRWWSR